MPGQEKEDTWVGLMMKDLPQSMDKWDEGGKWTTVPSPPKKNQSQMKPVKDGRKKTNTFLEMPV